MADTSSFSNVIQRLTTNTDMPYAELRDAFEAQLGRYDLDAGAQLVADKASWSQVEHTISGMAGPHGLMVMHHFDQGKIATLKGPVRRCALYMVGNPVVATQIVSIDIRAGLLVPFRVEIYDHEGTSAVSYDVPSSFLASLRRPELLPIGKDLDAKISAVVATACASDRP